MTPKDAIRNNFPEEEFQLYAIALFDVLGFSELHKKVGTKDLYSTYADLINFVIIASKAPAMLKYETIEGTSVAIDVDIRYVYFSDTIVLWTTFNPKHFDLFLKSCSELVADAILAGLPLRGAMSIGNAIMDEDKGIFLGEPIIETAELEKSQDWIGLTFGNSFRKAPYEGILRSSTYVQFYSRQMKESYESLNSGIVLDWPYLAWYQGSTAMILEELTRSMNLTDKKIYYKKALEFMDLSERNRPLGNPWRVHMFKLLTGVEST